LLPPCARGSKDVIHRFNEVGLSCLNSQWAGGRPRLLSSDDEDFVVQTATTRPTQLGKPFTRWSVRKLVDHLQRNISRPVRIGREILRCLPPSTAPAGRGKRPLPYAPTTQRRPLCPGWMPLRHLPYAARTRTSGAPLADTSSEQGATPADPNEAVRPPGARAA
jgi:hypothetical protein